MIPKFKVGDRIVCVEEDEKNYLKVDALYTIRKAFLFEDYRQDFLAVSLVEGNFPILFSHPADLFVHYNLHGKRREQLLEIIQDAKDEISYIDKLIVDSA